MKKSILIMITAIIGISSACVNVYSAENTQGRFIYDYQKELGLTENQEIDFKVLISKLQNSLTDKQKKLNELQVELKSMIANSADLGDIKAKINDIAQIQAAATYEDIATSRDIETELTGTQLTKWRNMQSEFVKNAQQAQNAASNTK